MHEMILVRFGDLVLKGKNQRFFVQAANRLITEKLAGIGVGFDFRHDRTYIELNGIDPDVVIERLGLVSGLYSYSLVSRCTTDYDDISENAIEMIDMATGRQPTSFKVETKRADKTIPETSMDISRIVSRKILVKLEYLSVDVNNPELILHVEVRKDGAYVFVGQTLGLGGYPAPINGKAVVLLSGGIDSPVAAFLAIRKGLGIECIHFESTPLTPVESVQKVIDIVSLLARYHPGNMIRLHLVAFRELHEELIRQIPESYLVTIMRRMMVRIASRILDDTGALAIVTGDSIGQVASQTLESMQTIQAVTDKLIIRPLVEKDKMEIIDLARKIDTLDISNRPFSDCCSVYMPKNPSIRPNVSLAKNFEERLDYPTLINRACKLTKILEITPDTKLDLDVMGLSVEEALK